MSKKKKKPNSQKNIDLIQQNSNLEFPLPSQNQKHNSLTIEQKVHFGPLPPSQVLREYEELQPGLGKLIVEWADEEKTHRRKIESKGLTWDIVERILGQIFAFIISMTCIIGGIYAGLNGAPWVGSFIAALGLGGIVSTFIIGRSRNR